MVNGQWPTLYAPSATCSKHRGKSVPPSYIHQRCRNLDIREALNTTNHDPQQPFSSKVSFSAAKIFKYIVPEIFRASNPSALEFKLEWNQPEEHGVQSKHVSKNVY